MTPVDVSLINFDSCNGLITKRIEENGLVHKHLGKHDIPLRWKQYFGITYEQWSLGELTDAQSRCDISIQFIWEQLNTGYWKDVDIGWRVAYALMSLVKALCLVQQAQSSTSCPPIYGNHQDVSSQMGSMAQTNSLENSEVGSQSYADRIWLSTKNNSHDALVKGGAAGKREITSNNSGYGDTSYDGTLKNGGTCGKTEITSYSNRTTITSTLDTILDALHSVDMGLIMGAPVEDEHGNVLAALASLLHQLAVIIKPPRCHFQSTRTTSNEDVAFTDGLHQAGPLTSGESDRPAKQRRTDDYGEYHLRESSYENRAREPCAAIFPNPSPSHFQVNTPAPLRKQMVAEAHCPSLTEFATTWLERATPVLITGAMKHWPAVTKWSVAHIVSVAGYRTVPVELGSRYTDDAWTQKLMTIQQFVATYFGHNGGAKSSRVDETQVSGCSQTLLSDEKSGLGRTTTTTELPSTNTTPLPQPATTNDVAETTCTNTTTTTTTSTDIGKTATVANTDIAYLAQHELFDQIVDLARDICTPDYTATVTEDSTAAVDVNAWFGPAGTVSPAHTDLRDNLLCQVFGRKTIRLYHPDDTPYVYPFTGMLSNTSQVDVEHPDLERFPEFVRATELRCDLEPGTMLFIPAGWWHFVRSLEPSFSVSHWFS